MTIQPATSRNPTLPVDVSGYCCGFLVWVGGTIWMVVAARREYLKRPDEVYPFAVPLAGCSAGVVLFFVGFAIGLVYDILTTYRF
jgi:N6-adenosine-specific RNA methylase IME4